MPKTFTDFKVGDKVLVAPGSTTVFAPITGTITQRIAGGDYAVEFGGCTAIYRGYQVEAYSDERCACILAGMLRYVRVNSDRYYAMFDALGAISDSVADAAKDAFKAQVSDMESQLTALGHDPRTV